MSISIAIILDTRRIKKKTNIYPIKLRVTFERVSEYYQTIYHLSEENYAKLSASRLNATLQLLKQSLREIKRNAENASANLKPFTFASFEKKFVRGSSSFKSRKLKPEPQLLAPEQFDYSPFYNRFSIFRDDHSKVGGVSTFFFSFIKARLKEGRIGSAVCMHCSYKSLMKFRGDVCFEELTVNYLNEYEQWLLGRNVSKTTISIYVRSLRTIFNDAIDAGIIKRENATLLADVDTYNYVIE